MNEIPSLFGQPIYVWSGMFIFLLVLLQISIAKQWLKINFKYHRWNGWIILVFALFHGLAAASAYLLHIPVQGF